MKQQTCLFRKKSMFKSSKDILYEFSKSFLTGEGDILRHLGLFV